MKGFRTGRQRSGNGGRAVVAAILLLGVCRAPLAATVDRIAALVDRQVLTVSEISQMAEIRFYPHTAGQSDDDYRREILDDLIAQALRYRDVERYGAADVSKDAIEARLLQIRNRFAAPAEFDAALQQAELSLDEVRTLIKRELQVEGYIQERFAPMIVVSTDDIETYYKGPWAQQRRQRGLPIPPLAQVQDDLRNELKSARLQTDVDQWTAELRSHANVDIYTWR